LNEIKVLRPARRTARERLARLLAGYLPVLPAETRAAVLAAIPAPKLEREAVALQAPPLGAQPKVAETVAKPAAVAMPEDFYWISGPDSDNVFIDKAGRAHRVEDLPADLRREVEEAIGRPVEPLPSNEMLREASLLLWPTIRHLPAGGQQTIIVAVARGLVDREALIHGLEREVRWLRKVEAWTKALPKAEPFPGVCPICGVTPAPNDGHQVKRWPASGMPELTCSFPGRGGRRGDFVFLGMTWLGPEDALRYAGDPVAAGETADGGEVRPEEGGRGF
jgi:hypothetical protein